jgi:transcriptional regulator with XRE-family HTH domain
MLMRWERSNYRISGMSVKSPVPLDKVVGRRVRARRLQLGLSQRALGDALGISYQQVQKYEQGVSRIGAGRLQQVAEILNVPVSVFFDEKLGGSQEGGAVFAFLDTAYSLRLVQAFARIPDRGLQQCIVHLVEQASTSMSAVGAMELTTLDRHVGARIRGRRLELQLSESSAAEALRCTIDHLRASEEGRAHISAVLLFEMSRLLDVEVRYFFDGISVNAKLNV